MLAMVKGGYRNKNVSEFRIALWGVCVYLLLILCTVVALCASVLCMYLLC